MKGLVFLFAVLIAATGVAVGAEPTQQVNLVRSEGGVFQPWMEDSNPEEGSGRLVLGRLSAAAQDEEIVVWERTGEVHSLTVLNNDSNTITETTFAQMEIDFGRPHAPTWIAIVNGETRYGVMAITADRQGAKSGSLMMWQTDDNGELVLIVDLPLDDTDSLVRGGIVSWGPQVMTPLTTEQTGDVGTTIATMDVGLDVAEMELVTAKDHCSCLPVNGSCMPKKCDLGSTCSTPGNYCKWTKAVAPA